MYGYPNQTLPLSESAHGASFVACFRNGATAMNYVGYIKAMCVHMSLVTSWHNDTVKATLRGAKRKQLRLFEGPKRCKFLITIASTWLLYKFNSMKLKESTALFHLVCWEYLLRRTKRPKSRTVRRYVAARMRRWEEAARATMGVIDCLKDLAWHVQQFFKRFAFTQR